jgi:hypothetical protein
MKKDDEGIDILGEMKKMENRREIKKSGNGQN